MPATVGVDVAEADTSAFAFDCRGVGQVFLATDTLIQSISTWRPAKPALDAGERYLFITETLAESEYEGAPDVRRLLLDAGPLVRHVGDGIHPVEYRWVFDPPFPLPHPGKFFFAVLTARYASFYLSATTTNPYPEGRAWSTSPVYGCSQPGYPYGDDPPGLDLVFEVRFCSTDATLTQEGSWGRLKLIYR